MSGILRWENPPGRRPYAARTFDGPSVAALLRARPDEWAVVCENPANVGMAWLIKNGKRQCWRPVGAFESAVRNVNGVLTIYARYVGERS